MIHGSSPFILIPEIKLLISYKKGSIEVSAFDYNNIKKITIHDTGCGIPDNLIPGIFDFAFTTKGYGKGSGVGLYIVKDFADKLHLDITIESEIDNGTTFSLVSHNSS